MADNQDVLLVIPCFRESGRLRPFLESLCTEVDRLGGVQILVVEDGAGAEEAQRMAALVAPYRERYSFIRPVQHLDQNVGKGGAIYAGWLSETEAHWLAFADADGSCDATEVTRMIRLARDEAALARAYYSARIHMLGRTVHRLWYRHVMGRVYATLVEWLLHTPAYDTQCGLKVVPRQAFQQVHGRLMLRGFAFDVELMVALQCAGTEVVEVPINWHETPGGKLDLISEPWRMLRDVLRVRSRRAAGGYHP
jgi:dolichyl-phosphate beta-glucosyltransferase